MKSKKSTQMKNTTPLKNLLGLSQEEMAIVLNITASQWSMYKSGKRDLPLAAKNQLASILLHLQNTETSKEKEKFTTLEHRKVQEWLEQEQRSIAYNKQLLEKKRATMENKRAECFAALEVVRHLEAQSTGIPAVILEDIKTRATNTLNTHSLLQLEKLQMKTEHLDFLQNSLEEKKHQNTNSH